MNKPVTAVVFPGQGTQKIGMGKDFYDLVPASRAVFEEASAGLGWDVAALCFQDNQQIDLTEFAQPCILTTEIAMLRGIQAMFGFSPDYFGGHSLGEYTALVAAGVFPFAETVKVVQERGRLMQAATPQGFGGMAAVITKADALDSITGLLEDLPTDVANINSREQIVISGPAADLPLAEHRIRSAMGSEPGFRYVPLNVSAPFHSRFMQPMQPAFQAFIYETLADCMHAAGAACVLSNYTGGFHEPDKQKILDALAAQISAPVRWLQNMEALAKTVERIYEIGPNRPLRGFFNTMGLPCTSVFHYSGAKKAFGAGPETSREEKKDGAL